ncbi:MAG TPA: nitrate reductase molybdenum cofactor assembly chaperone [Nocardioidaceae bacterium]|nr:nitrate reductase molybdenum cofactor assembly chaperone [Nocardioidaceae bacterium]
MSRRPAARQSPDNLAATWQAASVLLCYPDETVIERLPLVQRVADRLPADLGAPLRSTLDRLAGTPLERLQEDYVATFDNRRRCSLFLTYFQFGDTRKRGVALLRFKQAYLRSGYLLDDTELPDHLCVVLEYGAQVDRERAWGLLLDHRAGLEVLRLALRDGSSVWSGAVEAVTASLPTLHGDERDVVRRLAEQGPPDEEVGMSPYDGSAFDAALVSTRADLPMPTFSGASR